MVWTLDGRTVVALEDFRTTFECVGVWPRDLVQNIANDQGNNTTTPSSVASTCTDCSTENGAMNAVSVNPTDTVFDFLLAKVDGCWKMDYQGRALAGIGGFIKENKGGKMCYIFSGPVMCDSSEAAKVAAINHVLGAIIDSNRISREIQVHLDAKEVVHVIRNESNSDMKLEKELEDINDQMKKIPRLKLMHVPSESNIGVDELAKLGSSRKYMVASWV